MAKLKAKNETYIHCAVLRAIIVYLTGYFSLQTRIVLSFFSVIKYINLHKYKYRYQGPYKTKKMPCPSSDLTSNIR